MITVDNFQQQISSLAGLYTLERRKTLIPNRGRWSSLSLFRQIHLGEGKL